MIGKWLPLDTTNQITLVYPNNPSKLCVQRWYHYYNSLWSGEYPSRDEMKVPQLT